MRSTTSFRLSVLLLASVFGTALPAFGDNVPAAQAPAATAAPTAGTPLNTPVSVKPQVQPDPAATSTQVPANAARLPIKGKAAAPAPVAGKPDAMSGNAQAPVKPAETASPVPAAPAGTAAAPAQPKQDTGQEKDKTTSDHEAEPQLKQIVWPFDGMTGHLDRQAAQRGFQVYKQVCSACHSMNLVAYRSLGSLGFSEAEVKALAAEKQVDDYNDKGERIQRPGKPSDHIVPPYPNEDASRAANGGAYPPDLSLIAKARHQGPNYVYSILTGFDKAPTGETPVANKYYNPYFPGHWISMPPPLSENVVTYQDGTPATVDQMARDVITYLQWAAEPEMEQRKQMGITTLIFLFIMTGFFYVAKKRVWKNIEKH
jgi:ubiquinol-cytochrome c reductase cytochrome c1 subunit